MLWTLDMAGCFELVEAADSAAQVGSPADREAEKAVGVLEAAATAACCGPAEVIDSCPWRKDG